jgi:hypothetical protein
MTTRILILLLFSCIAHATTPDAAQLKGVLKANPVCSTGEAMIWLSVKDIPNDRELLLSHILVPLNGTFEFRILPGRYHLIASNPSGCLDEKFLDVKKSEMLNVSLELMPVPNTSGVKK